MNCLHMAPYCSWLVDCGAACGAGQARRLRCAGHKAAIQKALRNKIEQLYCSRKYKDTVSLQGVVLCWPGLPLDLQVRMA